MQKDNYALLIGKLDEFIRKFYINQLLRGALYTVGLVLGMFILLNVLEYYFYFGTTVRTAMFWTFMAASGVALYRWVGLPLLHYFHLGKVITHEQASQIIGNHFNGVKDKLLNILQLKQQSSNAIYADLINASINQKSDEIKLVPFKSAIDLSKNRKHLRWALPPLLLLLFMLFGAPNILKEGTKRLWNSSVKFEKPAPFKFLVNADSLKVVQFSDYFLKVKVDGQALPNEVFIDFGKVQYRLTKDAANEFSYKFTNVQRDTEFKLFAGGVESNDYALSVIKKPSILSFNTKLVFPEYIGRSTEELANIGDLVVPQGTNIAWVFNAQNTDVLGLQFGVEGGIPAKRFGEELFQYNRKALKDEPYKVFISNQFLPKADSVGYTITVIPDLHPQISVQEFKDSANTRLLFFAGDASDDYGLLNLTFNYQIKKVKGGQLPMASFKIEKPAGKQTQYEYNWDLKNIDLQPGDEITYYFEVFDNDGVNGSKNARTAVMQYRLPSLQEMEKKSDATSESIKKDLEKALKESMKVQEEMKKLRDKVLQKKELDWQSKKELEKLMNRQKQLNEQLEQAKTNFEENKKQQEQFQQKSEDILKKEDELKKLMDETMSEDMKKLMEDIEKLLQEMNKEEALEQMDKMQQNSEEMTKELDRLEELYKRLEVETKLEQNIEKLEKLAEEQQKLAEETEKNAKTDEEIKKEQEELNKKMDEIEKNQEDLLKKNEELKKPEDIEKNKEEMDDIQEDQKESQEQIDQKSKSGASKKQKSAANKMKNLANKMKAKKDSGEMKQIEEDVKTLRQLLENLVGLSFAQEQNMKDIGLATINTPRYVELAQQQYKIKDDFKLVEDSLQAIASRNFQIESIVTEKVTEIKAALKNSLSEIEERHVAQANEQQQRSMKSLNDLALMLSEIMGNMQQKMADAMPGDQSCQNPGKGKGKGKGGKEPKDKMSKGQQGLGEGLQELKKRLEEGKQGGKDGKSGMSKEFAKLAAQQAALRNALREMQKQKQEGGKGSKGLDELMQEMDKIETDLVNKKLSNETMKRQQDIMTRLLEEERAEREKEQDEQRQAESAKQQPTKLPPALEEYLKKRRAEVDLYKTVSPALKPYYKGLVEEYIKAVQK
jgi:hypothetical protein